MALLADGERFAGAIERSDVPPDARDDMLARDVAPDHVETIEPDAPVRTALAGMDARQSRRLVVLDADGRTLRGLICLTRDRNGFCG